MFESLLLFLFTGSQVNLYLLRNVTPANQVLDDPNTGITGCEYLKYMVQPVNATNMLLLVVDKRACDEKVPMLVEAQELLYSNNASLACRKNLADLPRRKPDSCIRSHPKESEIKDLCGRAPLAFLPSLLETLLLASSALLIWARGCG